MKFLLTSGGVTNPSIAKALEELAQKPLTQIRLAYIPTAASAEDHDMSWVIENLKQFDDLGIPFIDILDFTSVPKEMWLARYQKADVICVGGGNPWYLIQKMQEFGFVQELRGPLKDKVYMGISAGSMVTGTSMKLGFDLAPDEKWGYEGNDGLGFTHLEFIPHLNSEYFPRYSEKSIRDAYKAIDYRLYALDDEGALKIQNGTVEVVSEGEVVAL